jgi:hypothetical protein
MKKFIAIFITLFCLPLIIQADDEDGNYVHVSCPEYTYDGDWVKVNVHLYKLIKNYNGMDLDLITDIESANFKVAADSPTYSVIRIKNNHYRIHFDLEGRMKDAEVSAAYFQNPIPR